MILITGGINDTYYECVCVFFPSICAIKITQCVSNYIQNLIKTKNNSVYLKNNRATVCTPMKGYKNKHGLISYIRL